MSGHGTEQRESAMKGEETEGKITPNMKTIGKFKLVVI